MEEVFWREETSRQQCSQNSRCGRCPGSFWRNTKDAKLHSRPCHHGLRVLRVTHETEGDAETITVQIFSVRNSLISFRVALWANGGYVEHCDGMRRAGCGQQAREAGKKSSGFRWWARPEAELRCLTSPNSAPDSHFDLVVPSPRLLQSVNQ